MPQTNASVVLVNKSRLIGVANGAFWAIVLFSLEGSSDASRTSVSTKVDRFSPVSDRVLFREDDELQRGEFCEWDVFCVFHGREIEPSAFLKEGYDLAYTASHDGKKLAVISRTTK